MMPLLTIYADGLPALTPSGDNTGSNPQRDTPVGLFPQCLLSFEVAAVAA
jgi:hypothetical protein